MNYTPIDSNQENPYITHSIFKIITNSFLPLKNLIFHSNFLTIHESSVCIVIPFLINPITTLQITVHLSCLFLSFSNILSYSCYFQTILSIMNDDDVKKQIKQMCDFILQEAREKANEIKVKTEEEYQIDLANQTQSGKAKVREEYALKEKGLDVQKRIAQSIEISKQNARKLGVREQLLNDLLQTTKEKLNKICDNQEEYKKIIKSLIIQGLIKIQENNIVIRCRQVDLDLVRSVMDGALEEYKQIMKNECQEDSKVTLTLNEQSERMLPPPPGHGPISCSGGVVLEGCNGKVILENTFDSRLEICFHDLKPIIRNILFPRQD